jgi:hypothetical protein
MIFNASAASTPAALKTDSDTQYIGDWVGFKVSLAFVEKR